MNINKIVVGVYEENCYLLTINNDLLIIDPGDEFEKIDNVIKNNNYNLLGILITHAHFDHIGALEELINKYKVPIYYNNVNNEINYDNLIDVEEKEYIIKNFEFKVIYFKGHRNDLVAFYFYKDNAMFVGDFVFKDSVGRCDLEYANIHDFRKSIDKIKKYDDDIKIYPGHGDETILGYEKNNNYYFN